MKKPNFKRSPAHNKLPGESSLAEFASSHPALKREALSTILVLVAALLIALFTQTYILQSYIVDGVSMENTLQERDRLLVDKIPLTLSHLSGHQYLPKRGDIIIFNQGGLPGYIGSKQLVKRVIGLPGDRIVVKDGKVTIYNSAHTQGFDPDKTGGYHTASYTTGGVDLRLGTKQLFVCGDNRANSEDSRFFGPIDSSQIVGKLSFRVYPFGKIQHF